jgi:hypothetical protein
VKTYIIGYDLVTPGQDYKKLFEAIKSYPGYYHMLDSTWLVQSSKTASEICNHLMQYIDRNDKLFVGGWTGEGAWYGLEEEGSKWLKAA